MSKRRKCLRCGLEVCNPCVPDKPDPAARIVVVASDTELRRLSHFQRLAMATRALDMPRRKIPDWIADTIYGFKGRIVRPNGDAFIVDAEDGVDGAFGDDGSFRWLSDFLKFAETPPRQRPQDRTLARLRLIDLAFRIAHPERAAQIAK